MGLADHLTTNLITIGADYPAIGPANSQESHPRTPSNYPEEDVLQLLPFEDHAHMGGRLKALRAELGQLRVALGHSYSPTTRVVEQAARAVNAVDRLRSELDAQLSRDHPAQFTRDVYYADANAALGRR